MSVHVSAATLRKRLSQLNESSHSDSVQLAREAVELVERLEASSLAERHQLLGEIDDLKAKLARKGGKR
jgi:predicted transcriptional regulator